MMGRLGWIGQMGCGLALALLLGGAAAHRATAGEAPAIVVGRLSGFDSAEEMAKWLVRGSNPPTVWALSAEHVRQGTHCAKLANPDPKRASQKWPAVTLPAVNLSVRDWSPYDFLAFEVFNAGEKPAPLVVMTRAPQGATWTKELRLASGQQTVRVPLEGAPKTERVGELHFFYNEPTESYTLYLDDLRLETGDLRLATARLQDAVGGALREAKAIGPRAEEVATRLRAISDRATQLAGQVDSLVAGADPSALQRWRKALAEAEAEARPVATDVARASFEAELDRQGWAYGWTHSLDKVFRQDRPYRGQYGGTLRLEMAANEHEGTQLVLRSRKLLRGVRVVVSDLLTEDGQRIAAGQIEVLPVGYVDTKKPRYPVDYVGWWPDPLLNFLPEFDLDAEVWQPVWLDVHTAESQPAGRYKGTVTVTAKGAPALRAPIEVTVWGFAVPKEYHFPLAVTFYDGTDVEDIIRPLYSPSPAEWRKYVAYCRGEATEEDLGRGEARRLADFRRKCHDLILAHHLIPDCLYRNYPPRIDDVRRWKEAGARWFNIVHIPGIATLKPGAPYPAAAKKRILDTLEAYVPKLEREGLLDLAYVYGFDEVGGNEFAALRDIFGEIRKRYPTLRLMTTAPDTSFGLDTGLDPYVDVWVPLTPQHMQLAGPIAAARARGRKVWWYVCCTPVHPLANWFIEYTATEQRLLMGFMAQKFGSDGFLYYSMNYWKSNQEVTGRDGKVRVIANAPFKEPLTRGPLTNSNGRSWGDFNGDGLVFYPGPDRPVPSLRMKAIRDGLEDYEYLWLLKRAVGEAKAGKRPASPEWLKRAEAALAVDPRLVATLLKYSTDGADILAARRAVAELLIER